MINILIICLFLALLLPYLAKVPVAMAMNKLGGYDNQHPRTQQSKLSGFGARALSAHQNAFESAIIFSAAILLVLATHSISELTVKLAITHIGARLLYHVFYLTNHGVLRSSSWAIATVCSFSLIWQCLA